MACCMPEFRTLGHGRVGSTTRWRNFLTSLWMKPRKLTETQRCDPRPPNGRSSPAVLSQSFIGSGLSRRPNQGVGANSPGADAPRERVTVSSSLGSGAASPEQSSACESACFSRRDNADWAACPVIVALLAIQQQNRRSTCRELDACRHSGDDDGSAPRVSPACASERAVR